MVFLPRRKVEVGKSGDLRGDSPPRSAEVEGMRGEDNFKLMKIRNEL